MYMLANGENNNKMGEEEEDEHDACFQQDIKKGRRRPKSLPAAVPFFSLLPWKPLLNSNSQFPSLLFSFSLYQTDAHTSTASSFYGSSDLIYYVQHRLRCVKSRIHTRLFSPRFFSESLEMNVKVICSMTSSSDHVQMIKFD